MVGFNAIKFSQRYSISFLLNTFVGVNMDLNELAKQPETVLALMEGELLFQFHGELTGEREKEEQNHPNPSVSNDLGRKEVVESAVIKEPQPIPLVILVFLKGDGTVPEEQREFLRKMIRATEIPGSHMKYKEFHHLEEVESWKKEWIPQRWLSFGLNNQPIPQFNMEDKWGRGIESPTIESMWSDVPTKTILWKLMQEYFNLKKA